MKPNSLMSCVWCGHVLSFNNKKTMVGCFLKDQEIWSPAILKVKLLTDQQVSIFWPQLESVYLMRGWIRYSIFKLKLEVSSTLEISQYTFKYFEMEFFRIGSKLSKDSNCILNIRISLSCVKNYTDNFQIVKILDIVLVISNFVKEWW